MTFNMVLYGIAAGLAIYIIVSIAKTRRITIEIAIALLGIVVSIILALRSPFPSDFPAPINAQTPQPISTVVPSTTETLNWGITFEYRFPAGYWSVGTHEYTLQSDCPNIEDGSGIWTNVFSVSETAQLLSGDVYLRLVGLRDKPIPEGSKSVEIIHPMQTTIAAATIIEISQSDAERAFRDCMITVAWDGGEPSVLTPGLPFQQ